MSLDEFDLTISDLFQTPGRRKNKWDATAAPTTGDDSGDGYEIGSIWLDQTNDKAYILTDSTLAAAVWKQIAGTGVGVTDHGALTGLDDGDHDSLFIDLTNSGAVTVNRANGATQDLTLTGNCTFTLAGAFVGKSTDIRLILRQDATGGRTVTWPTITWVNDDTPPTLQTAANAVDTIGLLSVDDGVTWFGYYITDPVLTLNDLTDVDTTGVAEGDALIYNGTTWVAQANAGHYHIVGEPQTGDGSTTVFYLAQEAESDTIAAYVAGSRTDVTQDTTEPDKVTFSAAPAAASAIRFDYVPVMA